MFGGARSRVRRDAGPACSPRGRCPRGGRRGRARRRAVRGAGPDASATPTSRSSGAGCRRGWPGTAAATSVRPASPPPPPGTAS